MVTIIKKGQSKQTIEKLLLNQKATKKFELIVPSIINKNQNFIINNLPANSSLKVFDALGQIVYQSNNYQNNFMPLMANAVYLVELAYVVDNQNKKYDGKLLVVE